MNERIESGLIILRDRCIADLEGVPDEIINDPIRLKKEGEGLAEDLGLTREMPIFYPFPARNAAHYGATGGDVLAESHLIWSSWPEVGQLSIDLFSCSPEVDLNLAPKFIVERYHPQRLRFARVPQPPYVKI